VQQYAHKLFFFVGAKMRLTTKTIQPTGRFRSFSDPEHVISYGKCWVGNIDPKSPFKIRLMVNKTEEEKKNSTNPNCPWKWVTLKKEFNSVTEAKNFVKDNSIKIIDKFSLPKD